jgi:glycerol-3-phosphate cytidylyltransferase
MSTGFICGAFDLLHPGHVILLADCAKRCDKLLVGLHTDPSIDRPEKNKPLQTTFERFIQLVYHKSVYHVIPYDTEADLCNLLATMDIQIRFLGSDYIGKTFTGLDICDARNIEIQYIDRYHSWSSSELRDRNEFI